MFGIDEILGEKPTAEATLMLFKPVMIRQGLSPTVVLGKGLGIGSLEVNSIWSCCPVSTQSLAALFRKLQKRRRRCWEETRPVAQETSEQVRTAREVAPARKEGGRPRTAVVCLKSVEGVHAGLCGH